MAAGCELADRIRVHAYAAHMWILITADGASLQSSVSWGWEGATWLAMLDTRAASLLQCCDMHDLAACAHARACFCRQPANAAQSQNLDAAEPELILTEDATQHLRWDLSSCLLMLCCCSALSTACHAASHTLCLKHTSVASWSHNRCLRQILTWSWVTTCMVTSIATAAARAYTWPTKLPRDSTLDTLRDPAACTGRIPLSPEHENSEDKKTQRKNVCSPWETAVPTRAGCRPRYSPWYPDVLITCTTQLSSMHMRQKTHCLGLIQHPGACSVRAGIPQHTGLPGLANEAIAAWA